MPLKAYSRALTITLFSSLRFFKVILIIESGFWFVLSDLLRCSTQHKTSDPSCGLCPYTLVSFVQLSVISEHSASKQTTLFEGMKRHSALGFDFVSFVPVAMEPVCTEDEKVCLWLG